MAYAVELRFDGIAEQRVQDLINGLSAAGISDSLITLNSKPHISLAVYSDIDVDRMKEKLSSFDFDQFNGELSGFGCFRSPQGALFLTPEQNQSLIDVHAAYHKEFKEFSSQLSHYYLPGEWVPHCTIAIDISQQQIDDGLHYMTDAFSAIPFKVSGVDFISFRPIEHLYFKTIRKMAAYSAQQPATGSTH